MSFENQCQDLDEAWECPTCLRPMPEEYDYECGTCEAKALCELLNKLERELAEAKEQCSNLDDQVSAAMMVIRGLERERDRLAEALRELCEILLNDKPRDITESLYKAGDALAAWKEARSE